MNSHHSLTLAIGDILHVLNPTEDDWGRRFQIINDLRAVVEPLETLRGATVEPFGSFVSNLFSRWGDLDISIELSNGSYISAAGKKYKQELLLDVLRALRRRGGFHGLKFISHARVPILKCVSKMANISCDISINNLCGQMKSKILFWINAIDGRFRDMVLLVKEWAKTHGINDPKTGTLNSYSLSVLVIFHFQTCEPAILPPLREIYQGNMIEDLIGVRVDAEKRIEDACGVSINRIKSDKRRPINESSLAELFVSFLGKFCEIDSRASTQGVSPFNGRWEDIDCNMIWQPKTYALFIEDPFEQPLNCARAVSPRNLLKIAEAFRSSYQRLTSPNQIHPITVLVRPEVISIMSRSPVPGFNRIRPQLRTTGPSPSPSPPQQFQGSPVNWRPEQFQRIPVNWRPEQAARQFQRNPVGQRPGQAVKRVQADGVNQVPQGQTRQSPKNPVGQKPGQVAKRVQADGVNQVSQSQIQQSPKNPNGVRSQVQQKWRPRSEK